MPSEVRRFASGSVLTTTALMRIVGANRPQGRRDPSRARQPPADGVEYQRCQERRGQRHEPAARVVGTEEPEKRHVRVDVERLPRAHSHTLHQTVHGPAAASSDERPRPGSPSASAAAMPAGEPYRGRRRRPRPAAHAPSSPHVVLQVPACVRSIARQQPMEAIWTRRR